MPNALMPDTSSYADPTGNALLGKGYDPNAAMQGTIATMQGAQNLQMNSQVMQLRAAQIGQEQLTLGRQKLQALNGVLGGLVANPTADNATQQIGWAVQNGVIDPKSATQAAGEVAGLGGDPGKIKQWALDHLNQNAQHEQLMDQAYGKPIMLNNGAVSSPAMVRDGAGGGYYPAAGPNVVQQLGPEAATTPQTGPINPDGSPTQTTRGAAVQRAGGLPATVDPFGRIAYGAGQAGAGQAGGAAAPPVSFGGGQGAGPTPDQPPQAAGQGGAPASPAPAPSGGAVPPGRQPPAPVQAPGPSSPYGAPPAPITVGLAPGVAEGKAALAGSNAKAVSDLQAAADTVPQQNAAIDNLSAQLGKISTGPLASKINYGKATYNQLAGMAGLPQIDPQGVAAMEEFHKSAAQLVGASMTALGGVATNDKLGLALAQNPNDTLSNMGNAQVIPLLKGLSAAVTVKNEAQQRYLQAHGGDPSTIGAFQADWNRSFSPRAFQFAYASPQQRQDMLSSMSAQEQSQLAGALDTAESRGWLKPGATR